MANIGQTMSTTTTALFVLHAGKMANIFAFPAKSTLKNTAKQHSPYY